MSLRFPSDPGSNTIPPLEKPGCYVGVAPQEEDEDFDFEETLRDIHIELAGLNDEAVELAKTIQQNFEELGV